MQYTENYQFREPTPATDVVKVGDINYNSRKIDEILHDTQISLADAYDSTRTSANPYNTGDVVMYELLMYKCKEDGVYGNWDATKWERTTAGASGSGGSDVEANPSGTATDTLNKIGIDGTIYGIEGGGGAGGGGCFIDTTNVIYSQDNVNSVDYTATSDCYVMLNIESQSSGSAWAYLDGELVGRCYTTNGKVLSTVGLFVKKGQRVTTSNTSDIGQYLRVYGLTYTTQNIQPLIYSTEEREVGVWTDGKPLYCKTFPITTTVITTSGVSIPSIDISGMDDIIRAEGVSNNKQETPLMAYDSNGLKVTSPQAIEIDNVVLYYTKTTDTAGSGIWTPSGVPAMHLEDDEETVIGTYNGKTLYEKIIVVNNPVVSTYSYVQIADLDETIELTGKIIRIINDNRYEDYITGWSPVNNDNVISLRPQGIEYYINSVMAQGIQALKIKIQYTKSSS